VQHQVRHAAEGEAEEEQPREKIGAHKKGSEQFSGNKSLAGWLQENCSDPFFI
jgi:hypothetical protein